ESSAGILWIVSGKIWTDFDWSVVTLILIGRRASFTSMDWALVSASRMGRGKVEKS
ncbi:unnamed protein product, partial [Rotaria sp. Silwood2]